MVLSKTATDEQNELIYHQLRSNLQVCPPVEFTKGKYFLLLFI